MTNLTADQMYGAPVPLQQGEVVVARFAPDRQVYWRIHVKMAVIGGVLAGLALRLSGNPDPWVGPVAAALAMAMRGYYLRSEIFAEEWRLTNLRLLGPAGRIAPLARLKLARPFLGAVQIVTQNGDKHLIKYQANADAVAAQIMAAKESA